MLFNTENLYPTHIYVTSPATGQLPEVGVDHIPLKKWSGERERERGVLRPTLVLIVVT